ncbi:hypothetical protein KSP35_03045 [Aquihabitans sp. G128]|uniref:hypothetical protein n=1 Tax=Aquihabitans sp. G128 TaxID=2849779 RepID=UPI001C21FB3D|nr:hypothetical protein [Aquihabitans sp. G128]QXC61827.1 hypothetical protein KSP35_03045 [Aquihabitans sp. G128]
MQNTTDQRLAGRRRIRALLVVLALGIGATACSNSDGSSDADRATTTTTAPTTTTEARPTTTEVAVLPSAAETCGGIDGTTAWLDVDGVGRIQTATIGSGDVVAIFLHQSDRQGMCGFAPFAERLAGEGVRSILVNQCEYGASRCAGGAAAGPAGWPTVAAAAVAQARTDGATRVVLVGASAGGTLAVATAGVEPAPAIDAIVDLSGPIAYGQLDSEPAAAQVRQAVLVITAPDDPDGPTEAEAKALLAAMPSTDKRLELATEQPGTHGWALLGDEGAWTPRADEVSAFVRGG